MKCYGCTKHRRSTTAAASYHDCGAGICQQHAIDRRKRITAVFAWSQSAP
jgi:hypothetical protein